MRVDLLLDIDTQNKYLRSEIINNFDSFSSYNEIKIPGDVKITSHTLAIKKAFGMPETLELIISFSIGIASGVVASWIYEKLKGRAKALYIDRTKVEIRKGDIEKIIIEKIKKG